MSVLAMPGEPRLCKSVFTATGENSPYCFCLNCSQAFIKGDEAIVGHIKGSNGLTVLVAFCDDDCLAEYREIGGFEFLLKARE